MELDGSDNSYWLGDTELMLDEIEEFLTGVRGGAEPNWPMLCCSATSSRPLSASLSSVSAAGTTSSTGMTRRYGGNGLSSLADKSLVRAEEDEAEPRFGMLQVMREFALEKLEAGSEAEAMRRRHAEQVMALAERAGPELVGFEMRDWNRRLRRDEENLRSALRWAIDAGEPDIGLRTASAIWRYWHYWGVLREGRDWLEALLEQTGARTSPASQGQGA